MSNSLLLKFIQVCSAGNIEEFNKIFSSLSLEQKNEFIKFDRYYCFHQAATNGHDSIVTSIFNYAKSVTDEIPADEAVIPVFWERSGEGFKAALVNHHFNTAGLILSEEYLYSDCLDIIAENKEFIKTIWNSLLKIFVFLIFDKYCGKDITVVQYILEIVPKSSHHLLIEGFSVNSNEWHEYDEANTFNGLLLIPFLTACSYGKLDIIQLLWDSLTHSHKIKIIETQFSSCYVNAAKNGHLDIIKQLTVWAKSEQKISFLIDEDFGAFIYAADRGYVEIVQFIWESLPTPLRFDALLASNFAAYRLATKNQHLRVIEYLEAHSTVDIIKKMKKAINQGVFPPRE